MADEYKEERESVNAGDSIGGFSDKAPTVPIDGHEKEENTQGVDQKPEHSRNWFLKGIKPAEWVMFGFTAFTAIAAWAGVLVAQKQWQLGRDQLKFAIDSASGSSQDTRAALKISDRLATAAEKQAISTSVEAIVAKQTLRMGYQSNIMFYANPVSGLIGGVTPQTTFIIQNKGLREIRNVVLHGFLKISAKNDHIAMNIDTKEKNPLIHISTISSGQTREYPISLERTLKIDEMNMIMKDISRLYIFGYAKFDDNNGMHIKFFCAQYYGSISGVAFACPTLDDR